MIFAKKDNFNFLLTLTLYFLYIYKDCWLPVMAIIIITLLECFKYSDLGSVFSWTYQTQNW